MANNNDAFEAANRDRMLNQHQGDGDGKWYIPILGVLIGGTRGIVDDAQGLEGQVLAPHSGLWGRGNEKMIKFLNNLMTQLKELADAGWQNLKQMMESSWSHLKEAVGSLFQGSQSHQASEVSLPQQNHRSDIAPPQQSGEASNIAPPKPISINHGGDVFEGSNLPRKSFVEATKSSGRAA